MFETIREYVPATRTLPDDRLTAIVAAAAVLVLAALAKDVSVGTILLGAALAVVVARRIGGRRAAQTAILVRPADEDEAPVARASAHEDAREDAGLDPLLARAMALRERTLTRT